MFDCGVFCNGAIHWLSHSETTSLRFDVDKEKLLEMPMPLVHNDPNWDASTVRYFGESNGHLHIVNLHHSRRTEFDVSEIERDYSGWYVKYRVDINRVLRAFPEMIRRYLDPLDMDYYGFSILCVVREEADEESSLVLHIPGKALRFNVKDGSFSQICDFATDRIGMQVESPLDFGWFDSYHYVETLSYV